MNLVEIVILALMMPVSALLIGLWVNSESRKITQRAHARARRETRRT